MPRVDGIAICAETYRAGLEKLGHEVWVFCPKRPESFSEPTSRIYRFPSLPNIWYEGYRDTWPFWPEHLQFIKALKLDVIHTFTPTQIGTLGLYCAHKYKIPLVTTCNYDVDLTHEYPGLPLASLAGVIAASVATGHTLSKRKLELLGNTAVGKNLGKRVVGVATGFYNDLCDLTTVPSVKTQKALQPYMEKQSVVLPLGTDLSLAPSKPDTRSLRTKYGLPQDKILFVSSSRLVIEKRIDFLIQAYGKLVKEEREKSSLVIIGDGPLATDLAQLASKLGLREKVMFMGRVKHEQVFEVVAGCDIYVHASLRETQGLVLNEAAACGKPLIMIDREVNPVLQDHKNGLFAKNSTEDFALMMSRLVNDNKLRREYGDASRVLAQESSQENVCGELEQLYKCII